MSEYLSLTTYFLLAAFCFAVCAAGHLFKPPETGIGKKMMEERKKGK